MGRRGVFDAFQAASGAVQDVLGDIRRVKQAEAQIEVQNASLLQEEEFNDFLLQMRNSGDWENYEKDWEGFRRQAYDSASKRLSSPYARRLFDAQFKEQEMRRRLMVRNTADQYRRLELKTNAFASLNNIVTSSAYADTEEAGENGETVVVTAQEKKMKDINTLLLNMQNANQISYDQMVEMQAEKAASVMLNDIIRKGMTDVDNSESLETVLSKAGKYKGSFTTTAGETVTQDAVMGKAKEAITEYFTEQRNARWRKNENEVSIVYKKMLSALNDNNINLAKKTAKEGFKLLTSLDEKFKGEGFKPDTRDEYAKKFMLQDDIKVLAGKSGGGSVKHARQAAGARMSPKDAADAALFRIKIGGRGEDGQHVKTTAREEIDFLLNEGYAAKVSLLGEEKAQAHTYEVVSQIIKQISAPPFATPGVAKAVKDIERTVSDFFKSKKLDTSGADYTRVLGNITGQALEYLINTGYEEQTSKGLSEVIALELMSFQTGGKINASVFKNDEYQETQAAELSSLIANRKNTGTFGEDLRTPESEKAENYLRGFAVREMAKAENSTPEKVLENFTFSVGEDGVTRVLDKKGNFKYAFAVTEDGKGGKVYRRFSENPGKEGYKVFTPDEKNARKTGQDARNKENAKDARVKSLGNIGLIPNNNPAFFGAGGDFVKSSEGYLKWVDELPKEDTDLLRDITQGFLQKDRDAKNKKDYKVDTGEREKALKKELERAKKVLSGFEDGDVQNDISGDFFKVYKDLKNGYAKVTLIDAYNEAEKKAEEEKTVKNVSLTDTANIFKTLLEKRGLKEEALLFAGRLIKAAERRERNK